MRIVNTLALVSCSLAPLVAADLTISDLRFSAGVLEDEFKGASSVTVTDGQGNTTTTRSSEEGRDADSHYRAQLQYVRGHLGDGGGFIYGIGLGVNHATWDDGSQDSHATTPSVHLLLGYGYAFTPAWHIEITPFAGYGRTFYSISDDDSSETADDSTDYVEYGAKIGTYFALGDDLLLGVEIPYLVGRFEPEYDYNDGADSVSVSDERRSEGFGLMLTIGGRF